MKRNSRSVKIKLDSLNRETFIKREERVESRRLPQKTIGIIGRPNVGKSTLFNRIAGRRISITADTPGVTRDRIEALAEWGGHNFKVVDTAGFDAKDDLLASKMREQVLRLMDSADYFILVTDGISGLHPLDGIAADILRDKGKPFAAAVNKIDTAEKELSVYDFYSLGAGSVNAISASHGRGVDDLLDTVLKELDFTETPETTEIVDERIRIAVIGRPNVGKSSLINAWLGEERVVVTPAAGTTRDAVDTYFTYAGKDYTLVDTAGLRKKSVAFKNSLDKLGYYRSIEAIENADIVAAVIDGSEGIGERDVKVIGDAWQVGRAVILVINKIDLAEGGSAEKLKREVSEKLFFLHNPPIFFVSAVTKKNIFKIFKAADTIMNEYKKRIPTAKVNELLEEALAKHTPPIVHNRRLKFYYMTQAGVKPPHFVVFVNFPKAVHFSYERFLVNIIRRHYGFNGVPIILSIRARSGRNNEVKPSKEENND
ncbi:MAG: ribosome biogenesis GTPase Der [Deferribacteraceae bacterium]|jgi:GTP-binding protein|nr:ribosome biogenesis GTPase Der [Deferribacteraceae bacterium]